MLSYDCNFLFILATCGTYIVLFRGIKKYLTRMLFNCSRPGNWRFYRNQTDKTQVPGRSQAKCSKTILSYQILDGFCLFVFFVLVLLVAWSLWLSPWFKIQDSRKLYYLKMWNLRLALRQFLTVQNYKVMHLPNTHTHTRAHTHTHTQVRTHARTLLSRHRKAHWHIYKIE